MKKCFAVTEKTKRFAEETLGHIWSRELWRLMSSTVSSVRSFVQPHDNFLQIPIFVHSMLIQHFLI